MVTVSWTLLNKCDNGELNSDTVADACRSNCTIAACGDGVHDAGEECDEGADNNDAGDCRVDCSLPPSVPPVVKSVARAGANPSTFHTLSWVIIFDQGVDGIDMGDFVVVVTGALANATVTSVTGSGSEHTVSVYVESGNGTVALQLHANATIVGSSGLTVDPSATLFWPAYEVDVVTVAPTVVSLTPEAYIEDPYSTLSSGPIPVLFTLSEPVTGVNVTSFGATCPTAVGMEVTSVASRDGGVGVQWEVQVGGNWEALTATRLEHIFAVTVDGSGGITDLAGNSLTPYSTAAYIVVDFVPPSVKSITVAGGSANSGFVVWTVKFSEGAFGVTADLFTLGTKGEEGEDVVGARSHRGAQKHFGVRRQCRRH